MAGYSYYDYVPNVGNKDDQTLKNALFFDYSNTSADQPRYKSSLYNKLNYKNANEIKGFTFYLINAVRADGTNPIQFDIDCLYVGPDTDYTLTYKNGSTTLATDYSINNNTGIYLGTTPTKASDANAKYTFSG